MQISGQLEGLDKGSVVRVHFNLNKIGKERTMPAKIKWISKSKDGKTLAGLEFMSRAAVYDYLLKYIQC